MLQLILILFQIDDKDNTSVPNAEVESVSAPGTQSSLYYNSTYSAENDITFVITPNTSEEELIEWLDSNKPSEMSSRVDNTMWINLHWENSIEKDEAKEAAVKQLWKEATEISYDSVIDIAKKTGYLEGKWAITSNIAAVDTNWKTVAMGILKKKYGEDVLQATVDCKNSRIRVYTKDITCHNKIFYCERKLREAGFRSWMNYRPSIFSLLKIRMEAINPDMYQTRYDNKNAKFIKICHEVYNQYCK